MSITLRAATEEDVPRIVDLLDIASFGFIRHFNSALSPPGTNIRHAIGARMLDPASQLSISKTTIAEIDGQPQRHEPFNSQSQHQRAEAV
jgi:hypothetical protein